MKMNKALSLLTATAIAASTFTGVIASAATADDIVPISTTSTYWFGDYITAGVAKGDLIADDHFYSPTGNSYAANKGNYEGHLNCLRLKNVQDMIQFEVAKPAEITIYSMNHASRGVVVTSTVPSSAYASYDAAIADTANVIAAQPVSSTSFTFTVDAATDFCLSNYGGDFFIAGVGVKILTSDPEISVSPTSSTINLGDTVTINVATQNTGDAAVVWSSDNEDVATVADGVVTTVGVGSANIIATVTVDGVDYSASCALTVQDVATVSYDISAYACEGTAPEAVTVTKGESVTIPVNNSLYSEGSTLTGWTDSSTVYAIGESITLTEDVTLTPWFAENEAALGNAETSVTYYFGESNGAQTIAVQGANNPSAIIVEQAVIGDKTIDVKLDIDATAGKFNNFKRGDKWAQVNGGTIINVPVIEGSVITMGDIYNDAGVYTIGGVECTGDGGTYTATEAGTVEIVAGAESGSYWESITVTYPQVEVASTPEPTATPTPTPAPTEEPAATIEWTATGATTVAEADGVYTVTQPTEGAAEAVSTDLLKIMANAPADITAADGTITVSYDLYRPSDKKGASDWFIDLSTNTTVRGWSGGNAGTFGRLSGYGPYANNFKLVPGTGATNGTVYQFNNAKDDEWTTVVFTVDLKAKSVKAAMGEDSSEAYTAAYPTGIENALYLNVVPSGTAPSNDAVLQFKNITAAYATPDPNAATPAPTAVPEPPVIPEGVDYYQFPGNKATMTNGNQCNNNDTFTFIGGVDEVAEAVFADPLNAEVLDDELVANYMNWIGGTYGSNPTFTATIPAGSYKLYVLGHNSGTNPPTATIGENVYQAGAGVNFATGGGKTLKLYTMELNLTEDITDASVILNTADTYLPDLYAVVIAGTKAAPAPEKTLPTVTVAEFGTYDSDTASKPAKAFTGTFTVDADTNYAVSSVVWTVGTVSATSTFETTVSGGTVVTGLVVVADDLAAIPAPTAVAVAAE